MDTNNPDHRRGRGFRLRLPDVSPESAIGLIGRLFKDTGRHYWLGYTIASFFMLMVAATAALSAWIMKDLVNRIFIEHRADWLAYVSVVIVVVSVLRGIGAYGSTVTLARVGNSIVARTQRRLYDHFLALGMDYYNRVHPSDMVTRMSYNSEAVRNVLNTVMTSLGRDLASVIGLVAVMVVQSPTLAVVALVVGPLAANGVRRLVKRVRAIAKAELSSLSLIVSVMQETAQGIRIVKAFNLEPIMRRRMNEAIEAVRARSNKMNAVGARSGPLMESLGGLAVAGVTLWAGYAAIFHNQQPGVFTSFLTAILLAYEPAKRLANTRVQIERGLVAVRAMFDVLDLKPSMSANPEGPELKAEAGEIVFDKVTFAYARAKPVLRRLDLRILPGKRTALVGPSGAGKTTIINLIERYYDVAAGSITIDGQNIAGVRLASLRDQIALVSQDVILFRSSIRDNIRYGRPEATDAEVEEAARNAIAHDFIVATKKGYDTILDDGGPSLSGGQRQRIAIARAMIRNARIVLLDEATSSLDSESEHHVQLAFERLTKGRTTIVIAHRLSTVLSADRICVIVDGKVAEEGRHAELLAADNQYARLYRLQFEKHAEDNGKAIAGMADTDEPAGVVVA